MTDQISKGNRDAEVIVKTCEDGDALAQRNQRMLDLPRDVAAALGRETLGILASGGYAAPSGRRVDLTNALARALAGKVSLPPDAPLPGFVPSRHTSVTIQVCNRTTLEAARPLAAGLQRVLALNFAAPTHPGGGFLSGARAQEEALARSLGLHATLEGDPMYAHHAHPYDPIASDWAILSPEVPVFRDDGGTLLEEPWTCSFLTCAAPQAMRMTKGDPTATMRGRISRVLAIARAYGYHNLVLGAWGCGAFGNDPVAVAGFFRNGIMSQYLGDFERVVFAITDWSSERRFLAPFRDAFQERDAF